MRRLPVVLLAVFALAVASCGGDDDDAAAPDGSTTTDDTTTDSTTTTTDGATTTSAPSPTASWEQCENPDGFSVSHPADWHVNDGSVVSRCSMFDPSSFEVPGGTDVRVAAINLYVEEVPFHEVATAGDGDEQATTAVDGHQAVRTVGPGGEFYGEDTELTQYVVDLSLGVDDGSGTLFANVPDFEGIDYDQAVTVLDRMVRTIELSVGEDAPENRVARYEGAAPFSAELTVQEGEPCVTTPTRGEPTTTCFTRPGADALRVADYSGELFSAFGGVAGSDVFRVEADTESGSFSFLPVGTGESDARGWVMPIDSGSVRSLTWYGIEGEQLGSRQLEGSAG